MSHLSFEHFRSQILKANSEQWSKLRRYACDIMIQQGFEEIGSSDITHTLYAEWRTCEEQTLTALLERAELVDFQ